MTKDTNVTVTVRSQQTFEGMEEDAIELITEGQLLRQGEAWVLTWLEAGEGMEGTLSTLRVEGETATLSREGPFRSEMVFEAGCRHPFPYHTPYGSMDMAVTTDALRWALTGREGQVEIAYRLEAGSRETGTILFQIHIRESDTI